MVVSNIFYFYPYLGRWSNLTVAHVLNGLVQPPTRSNTTQGLEVKIRVFFLPPRCNPLMGYTPGINNIPGKMIRGFSSRRMLVYLRVHNITQHLEDEFRFEAPRVFWRCLSSFHHGKLHKNVGMYFDLPFPASSLQHSWLRDKESNLLETKVKGALIFLQRKHIKMWTMLFSFMKICSKKRRLELEWFEKGPKSITRTVNLQSRGRERGHREGRKGDTNILSWCFQRLGGGFKHFYFHPYLGKIPILTNIFRWVETTN